MKKIFCLAGLSGSGKSSVAQILASKGYFIVRTGDVTDEKIKELGLEFTEENEKKVREGLRIEHGDDVYARLSYPKTEGHEKIVIDGVYHLEGLDYWKKRFGDIALVAVTASPAVRHQRLVERNVRGISLEESQARDRAQIENLGLGDVMEKASVVIENDGDKDMLKEKVFPLLQL
ncbi:MAG: AAA family ATPase [Candidatus Woesearchaeota archaeon]|nr:AAA family ATPase [Candidatus Woesearchaeota archaeon]